MDAAGWGKSITEVYPCGRAFAMRNRAPVRADCQVDEVTPCRVKATEAAEVVQGKKSWEKDKTGSDRHDIPGGKRFNASRTPSAKRAKGFSRRFRLPS
jgi:hypothetical protein